METKRVERNSVKLRAEELLSSMQWSWAVIQLVTCSFVSFRMNEIFTLLFSVKCRKVQESMTTRHGVFLFSVNTERSLPSLRNNQTFNSSRVDFYSLMIVPFAQ